MTQVVPVQIDLVELDAIDASARLRTLRLVAVRDEKQRFPSRLEAAYVLTVLGPEHERVRTQLSPSTHDGSETTVRIERNAPVLLILGCLARNANGVSVPIHSLVLDDQHLAKAAAQLESTDDSIVHRRPDVLVLPRVHGQGRVEEPLLFLAGDPPIANRFRLGVQRDAKAVKRRLVDERRRLRLAPADGGTQDRQDLVQCGDLDLARVLRLGLEPVDDRRLLQRLDREVAEVLLQDLDSSGAVSRLRMPAGRR